MVGGVIRNQELDPSKARELEALAEKADVEYFSLKDGGAPRSVYLNYFRKARLIAALASGYGGVSWERAATAVYELTKAEEDPGDIIKAVSSEIETMLKEI